MKVYERNESIDFVYPDEMIKNLDYLNKHGKNFSETIDHRIFIFSLFR